MVSYLYFSSEKQSPTFGPNLFLDIDGAGPMTRQLSQFTEVPLRLAFPTISLTLLQQKITCAKAEKKKNKTKLLACKWHFHFINVNQNCALHALKYKKN